MKRTVYIPIFVLNCIGIAFGVFAGFFVLFHKDANTAMQVCAFLSVLALIAGLLYMIRGYRKEASVFYKTFMALFALEQITTLVSMANWEGNALGVWACAITFALTLMLSFAGNLGKMKSYLICIAVCAVYLLSLILAITRLGDGSQELPRIMRSATTLILAVNMGIMTLAKYQDKADRGTV